MKAVNYLIVDWGTTNFRAFSMAHDGSLIDTKEAHLGLLQVKDGDFASALEGLLNDWGIDYQSLPIYMAGMVGSAKGWVNVPYAEAPANVTDLVKKAHRMTLPWGAQAYILPGVSYNGCDDQYDVMRGEEIQLMGLAKLLMMGDFNAVLPGTHSKHAVVKDGAIVSFASYLTGEVYSVFSQHTMLGKGLPTDNDYDEGAFLRGVHEAQTGELTNKMFLAWTHRLFANLTEQQILDYLSGLLIGFELRNVSAKGITLVGGNALCQRYQVAAKHLNLTSEIFSGNETFLAGMTMLIAELSETEASAMEITNES